MDSSAVSPDDLVQGFLRAAKRQGTGALTIYTVNDGGRTLVRIASNSDDAGTKAVLSFLTKMDDKAVEAAAAALHASMMGAVGDTKAAQDELWAEASPDTQRAFRTHARVALQAAREHAGKTLNVQPLVEPS